jgi:hypothetical protein
VDWSETGLKTEDGEGWGAEYDEPADLTTTHQVVNIHQVEQLVQGVDCSEAGLKTEDGEGWGAEYDEPADLTTTHQVVNIHQVEQLVQGGRL